MRHPASRAAAVPLSRCSLTVAIKEQTFARYTVWFIGKGGRVLKQAIASPARDDFLGDEGYVRAKIVDSRGQMAWAQPVRVAAAGSNEVAMGHAR